MRLSSDLAPGTYYIWFDYKVSGLATKTQTHADAPDYVAKWNLGPIMDGSAADGTFGLGSELEDGVWYKECFEFTVDSTITSGNSETRFEAHWQGGDFQITLAPTVTIANYPREDLPGGETSSEEESNVESTEEESNVESTEEESNVESTDEASKVGSGDEASKVGNESTAGTDSKASNPDTGESTMAPFAIIAILLAGASIAVVVKKNGNKA